MSIKDGVLREQLCLVGKLLYDKGLIVGTQGNLSCRADAERILITPAGKCKGMLQPEDIVPMTPAGTVIDSQLKQSSEFLLHLHGYSSRPEFRAAVHAHPPYATAFAMAGIDLDVTELPEGKAVFGEIPFVPFAEPGTKELADQLGLVIVDYHTFLLENHGIVAFGANLMEAFFRVETAEQIAKTIYLSRMIADISTIFDEDASNLEDDELDEGESGFPFTGGRE